MLSSVMKIRVVFHGSLCRYAASGTPGEWSGEIPEGSNLRDLIRAIGMRDGEAAAATINGTLKSLDSPIPPDARVLLLPWMAGG